MADDVARLIMEVEALRAELRLLARQQGINQNQINPSNQNIINNPAVQAAGLHAMTARGFVSGLTGSSSLSLSNKTIKTINEVADFMTRNYGIPAYRIIGRQVYAERIQVGRDVPDLLTPLRRDPRQPMHSLWSGGQRPINDLLNFPEIGSSNIRKTLEMGVSADLSKMRGSNIFDRIADAKNKILSGSFGKVYNRAFNKYSRAGALMGAGFDLFSSIKTLEREFDSVGRPQHLTEAEQRAGVTLEDKFGKSESLSDLIVSSIGNAAANAGRWAAMGMAIGAMQDPKTFAKARMYMAGARGAIAVQSYGARMPATATLRFAKGIGAAGMGIARAFAPAAAALTAIAFAQEVFSENSEMNTWSKKNDESTKKLKSMMDESQSIDDITARQRIEAALQSKGIGRGAWSVGVRGGLSLLGIMDSPAAKEARLREEITQEYADAEKHAKEAQKHAELGNVKQALKAAYKARDMAGNLAPTTWQDPMRWHTMQEQAQRGKACFARWLNNRVSNRTGD